MPHSTFHSLSLKPISCNSVCEHLLLTLLCTLLLRASKTMALKQAWNAAFATYLAELDAQKPVIWCGDFNVVQDERDLAAASKKWNKSPGYTAIECDAHRELLQGVATSTSQPLVDVWRQKHPDAIGHYSECRSDLLLAHPQFFFCVREADQR